MCFRCVNVERASRERVRLIGVEEEVATGDMQQRETMIAVVCREADEGPEGVQDGHGLAGRDADEIL